MSGPAFSVHPDRLRDTANRTRERAGDLTSGQPPEVGDGGWPTQQATRRFHASVANANQGFSARLNDTADQTTQAADVYERQDLSRPPDAAAVDAKDVTAILSGVLKDITTGVTGAIGPLMSGLAGGAGALGSAAASGVGALVNSAAQVAGQAAVTGSKLNPAPAPVSGVGGGSGDGQADTPPAGQQPQVRAAGLGESRAEPMPHDQVKAVLSERPDRVAPVAMPMGVPGFGAFSGHAHMPPAITVRTVHVVGGTRDDDDQATAAPSETVVISVAPKWRRPGVHTQP